MLQKTPRIVPFFLAAVIALGAGGCSDETVPNPDDPATQPREKATPAFAFPDLSGQTRRLSEWDGRVVMVNFWAPWCPPCREEIPDFIELQERYGEHGLTIVGVAIDTQRNAQDYADTMGINYPILIAEETGIEVAKDFGNAVGALPYTVVLDRDGEVVFRHRNKLSYQAAEEVVKPLL